MSYISDFIKQYETICSDLAPSFESGLAGLLKEVSYKITQEKFSPSMELKILLKKLGKKLKEPIKIGIMGGRNAGKATFINTILKSHILPSNEEHSKKTYIISYGHSRSIIAHYKNKTTSGLNTLSLNSLTKEEIEKINYFEVKFPIKILKGCVLYKYPDINTQEEDLKGAIANISQSEILIWINRIDDLSSAEELTLLKPYILLKKDVSLCVLNHIDVLDKSEDIIPTLHFAKERFGDIFSTILPLSAKILYKEFDIEEEFFLQKELQKLYYTYSEIKSQDFKTHQESLSKAFKQGEENINLFYQNPLIFPSYLQNQQVNFEIIIDNINLNLIPAAKEQREKLIKKELFDIVDKIKKSYLSLINIYSKFISTLNNEIKILSENIAEFKEKTLEELELFFKSLHSDRNSIIQSILNNTHPRTIYLSLKNPSFLQMLKGKKDIYTTYEIDSQAIYQELLDQKSKPFRTYKALNYKFSKLALNANVLFENSIDNLNAELKKWQAKNELIKKKESFLSDFGYNNLRIFASKIYENIITDFNECLLEADKQIQILFCNINTQLESTRKLSIEQGISVLLQRISKDLQEASQEYVEKSLEPTKKELEKIINENFSIKKYSKEFLEDEGTFMEIFNDLQKNISKLLEEKIILVQKKISDLELLKNPMEKISRTLQESSDES